MSCYPVSVRTDLASTASDNTSRRKGVAMVSTVVMIPVLLGMAALAVDIGYLQLTRQRLQMSADASALAAAWSLFDQTGEMVPLVSQTAAFEVAAINAPDAQHTFEFGWIADPYDPNSPFIPTFAVEANAIRVVVTRTQASGNPLPLFFAGIFGRVETDVSASAVSVYLPADTLDGIPVALRAPGFGPIDPDIADANPGKDGPSEPFNGVAFEIGEQVTVFAFGKGKKAPVHLILNTNDNPGEVFLGKVMKGTEPPVSLSIGDEIDVVGDGTGHNGLGKKLEDRIDDDDPDNDIVILPIVELTDNARDDDGKLVGNVRIIDFVAVRLDAVIEQTILDPNNGNTIDIELLVGTVVQRGVSGSTNLDTPGVVDGFSVAIPQLLR